MADIRSEIWAAVPVKAFGAAKSRLSLALSAHTREGLARAMLSDVLCALRACSRVQRTVVITADDAVARHARSHGAEILFDQRCAGQTAAVEQAAGDFEARGVAAMLTLPGDLPLLKPADIDDLCALLKGPRGLVLAPAGNDGGTNALLCAPPTSMRFHFGDDSYARHRRSAEELGFVPAISDAAGFRLDIDRPADLRSFMATGSPTHAQAFLRSQLTHHVYGGILGTMA
jgi:2-phospho-L-lactate guanylyltransferase